VKLLPGSDDHQRETYSRRVGALLSGETVTPGKFQCHDCEYELEIEDGKVTNLPVCPECQGERWQMA
jgi:Zn finger protein HypA/HybF involved in hydrogenase expression